jgi:hypothetical protein
MLNVLDHVDQSVPLGGQFPPLPVIASPQWQPPNQSDRVVDGTSPHRLRIWANADSHDWQEMMNDVPGGEAAAAGQVMSYWDGAGEANYTLTLRSYWVLVPGSYTQVGHGNSYNKSYTTTYGISETDAQSISASLSVGVEGIGATIQAEFSHSVTTSSETSESTSYQVDGPDEGQVKVWMLWQLVDELCALGPDGQIVANAVRRADVNWSEHNPSGAYVNYLDINQHFPSPTMVPVSAVFPAA